MTLLATISTTTNNTAPPSPSLSSTSTLSWMQKSPNELIPMLKNAYSTLKDKERDLRLAAEIGKSLLENNMALKSNYEDLLITNQPYPTPTNSSSSLVNPEAEEYEYVPINRTREAMVEVLAKENQELTTQLETVLQTQEKLDRTNTRKSRQLEYEIEFLQTSLDHATKKIQELEEYRKKKTLTNSAIDETLEEITNNKTLLLAEIEQLKLENVQVRLSKLEIEKNLCASLHDLRILKQQCEQFQFTTEEHEKLKTSFEAQQLHIQELKESLEEHRHIVQKLRDRGIYVSSASSVVSSEYSTGTDEYKHNLLTELENAWSKHQVTPSRSKKNSTSSSSIFQPFQAIYNQLPNVDSALESIILKAGVVEKEALDDALSLIGRLENEYDHEKFLQEKRHIYFKQEDCMNDFVYNKCHNDGSYDLGDEDEKYYDEKELMLMHQHQQAPPSGMIGYTKHFIKSMIYMTWRWLRFTLIMMIAVLMNLKNGPDSL